MLKKNERLVQQTQNQLYRLIINRGPTKRTHPDTINSSGIQSGLSQQSQMKVAIVSIVLLSLLCVKLAEAGCCCSTTGAYSILPEGTADDAKIYVLDLLSQNYTAKQFLRRLGKLNKKWLTPLMLQVQRRLFHMNETNNYKYDFATNGDDFTAYCTTPDVSSLSSEPMAKASDTYFPFPVLSGILAPGSFPAAQDISMFEYWLGGVYPSGQITDAEHFMYPSPQRKKPKFPQSLGMVWRRDGFYVEPQRAYDMDATLCLRGYEFWFRQALTKLMDSAGNPNELYYWLLNMAIPVLAPQDGVFFVRWVSSWVLSYIGTEPAVEDLVCMGDEICDQNNMC